MKHTNTFIIESEPSRHTLLLNGRELGTFSTMDAAEKEATELARRTVLNAELRFELDFKWTLSDSEIRSARLEWESAQPTQ